MYVCSGAQFMVLLCEFQDQSRMHLLLQETVENVAMLHIIKACLDVAL